MFHKSSSSYGFLVENKMALVEKGQLDFWKFWPCPRVAVSPRGWFPHNNETPEVSCIHFYLCNATRNGG